MTSEHQYAKFLLRFLSFSVFFFSEGLSLLEKIVDAVKERTTNWLGAHYKVAITKQV